jgi:hypothetical protein
MKVNRNPQRTPSSEEIAAIISRYRISGLGLEEFARKNGLPLGRLHYWIYQKHPRSPGRQQAPPVRAAIAPVFREVKLAPQPELVCHWAAEINLPHGIAVRFSTAATAEWIGSVVHALRRPC